MIDPQLLIVIFMAAVLTIGAYLLGQRKPLTTVTTMRPGETSDTSPSEQATAYRVLVNRIDTLEAEVAELRQMVSDLRIENAGLRALLGRAPMEPGRNTPQLLLVFGTDQSINDREEQAIKQAGFDYRRCQGSDGQGATFRDFTDEVHRRRMGDSMYDYVDFAMHGGEYEKRSTDDPTGKEIVGVLEFRDGQHDFYELTPQLTGVKVVLLGACATTRLADNLAGTAGRVISYTESVPKMAAADFARKLMGYLKTGLDPDTAYERSRNAVVAVRPYVDIQ